MYVLSRAADGCFSVLRWQRESFCEARILEIICITKCRSHLSYHIIFRCRECQLCPLRAALFARRSRKMDDCAVCDYVTTAAIGTNGDVAHDTDSRLKQRKHPHRFDRQLLCRTRAFVLRYCLHLEIDLTNNRLLTISFDLRQHT